MTTALEGGEGSASWHSHSLPPGKTQYPLYRRLGGHQGRYGQVRKISSPPGFDPQTVQPVASHYTDWATWITRKEGKIKFSSGCHRSLLHSYNPCVCVCVCVMLVPAYIISTWTVFMFCFKLQHENNLLSRICFTCQKIYVFSNTTQQTFVAFKCDYRKFVCKNCSF